MLEDERSKAAHEITVVKDQMEYEVAKAEQEINSLKDKLENEKSKALEEISNLKSILEADKVKAVDELKAMLEEERSKANQEVDLLKDKLENLEDERTKALSFMSSSIEKKNDLAEKEQALKEARIQMGKLRQQLTDEEEKKNKSIHLLRGAKQRIMLLEEQLKSRTDEKAQASLLQSRLELELAEKNRQIEDLSAQMTQFSDWEAQKADLIREQSNIKKRLNDMENKEGTYELTKKENERLGSDLSHANSTLSQLESELKDWPLKIREYESKVDNLEAELLMSRKLFESKSIENDTLKIKVSELEARVYSSLEEVKTYNDDLEVLKQEVNRYRQESSERLQGIRSAEKDHKEAEKLSNERIRSLEIQVTQLKTDLKAMDELKPQIDSLVTERDYLVKRVQSEQKRALDLESEVTLLKADFHKNADDKDSLLQDLKMRQVQLQNINRVIFLPSFGQLRAIGN
jgi:chromosome segregation ATPase